MDHAVTRRTLLAGASAAAATGTLATLGTTAVAQTSGAGVSPFVPGGAPVAGTGTAVTPATLTAGLTYLTVDGASFFPDNPMATPREIGGFPGATTTAGQPLLAAL